MKRPTVAYLEQVISRLQEENEQLQRGADLWQSRLGRLICDILSTLERAGFTGDTIVQDGWHVHPLLTQWADDMHNLQEFVRAARHHGDQIDAKVKSFITISQFLVTHFGAGVGFTSDMRPQDPRRPTTEVCHLIQSLSEPLRTIHNHTHAIRAGRV